MKAAVCLFGYFDSKRDNTSKGDDGYHHIMKNIVSKVGKENVDFFVHNWQPGLKEKIIDLYEPKKYIFEDQIDFSPISDSHGIHTSKLDPYNNLVPNGYGTVETILSHFNSKSKTIKLKKEFEEENNIKYDCVILCRFDLGRINRRYAIQYPVQCINFSPELDMDYFYHAYWNLFNEGPADMWYYSNSDNMNKFIDLYQNSFSYLQPGSNYSLSVVNGWPESKSGDFNSNELLKPIHERSMNLHKYPAWMVVNVILLQKWFLMDTGLWQISKHLQCSWE